MWNFLTMPMFYGLIVLGCSACYPRVLYLIEREEKAPQDVKPTLSQRLAMFIPGVCVIFGVLVLKSMVAGCVLVLAYGLGYAGMIVVMRRMRGL